MRLPELGLWYLESLNNARIRFLLELKRHMQIMNVKSRTHLQYEEKNKYHHAFEEKQVLERGVPNNKMNKLTMRQNRKQNILSIMHIFREMPTDILPKEKTMKMK